MDRRDFIRKAAAGSAAVAVGGAALLEGCSGGKTGYKGLLLHPRLRSQRSGYIVEIPYLIPLVGGESCLSFCQGRVIPQTRLKRRGAP